MKNLNLLIVEGNIEKEKNKFKKGDLVKIIETRPISKLKTWEVIDK